MNTMTKVQLTGPVKIGSAWHKTGDEVHVDAEALQQLTDAGVIAVEALAEPSTLMTLPAGVELIFTQDEFDMAVEAKAKAMAEAAFDGALVHLETTAKDMLADIEALTAEKEAAVNRAVLAEAKQAELQGQIAGLEAALAAATMPSTAADPFITDPPAKKAKG